MKILIKYSIITISIILTGYHTSFAQTRISGKFDNKPLNEIFELLAKNYKLKFAYDNAAISTTYISGNFKDDLIEKALRKILKETNFEMLYINDVYVIRQKKEEPKVEPVKVVKYKVLGIVKEKGSGESLPYALIAVEQTRNGASTNTDGYFSLSSNDSDSLTLRINYLGFQPLQLKVAPQFKCDIITIELTRNNTEISNVEVVKNQHEFQVFEDDLGVFQWNSKNNFDPTSISNLDIAAPLQLLPGIDGTTESLSGLVVRHSPSDKNLFIYDGFTVYHIDHFFGAFTSFNSKAIKDIRITRGGFDSRWGGRASSVIEITGKTGNEKQLVTDIGADQLSSDIELEGPIGKRVSFVVAARRSFTDYYHSSLYYNLLKSARSDLSVSKRVPTSLSTDPDQPNFFFYDLNTKITFKPGPKDFISISGYQGYDNLKLNAMESTPSVKENSNWGNQGLGARWSHQWNSVFYHNITAGVSQYNLYYYHFDSRFRRRQISGINDTILRAYLTDNHLNDISINYNSELKIGSYNTLEFGVSENNVSISSQDGNSHYISGIKIIDTLKVYDNRVNNITIWAQGSVSKGALKAFRYGGRATYNNLTKEYYFEPRAQLSFKFSKKFSIKLAAGLYYQFVNRVLTNSNGSYRSIWKISDNKNFPVVKSTHLIGGFIWDFGSGFCLDVEGYSKNTGNISFEQISIKRSGDNKIVQEQKVFLMNSRAIGADLLFKKNWSKGLSWISYSLSRSLNKCDKLNGGDEYFAIDDHTSELKIVNTLSLKHWNFTAAWIYGSGIPWDEILLTPSLQISPEYEKNSVRLNPYHRMDVGLSYNFKIKKGDIRVGAKFLNVYNNINILSKPFQLTDSPYQDYLQGNSPFTYTEILGMGFTTSFFINLQF